MFECMFCDKSVNNGEPKFDDMRHQKCYDTVNQRVRDGLCGYCGEKGESTNWCGKCTRGVYTNL